MSSLIVKGKRTPVPVGDKAGYWPIRRRYLCGASGSGPCRLQALRFGETRFEQHLLPPIWHVHDGNAGPVGYLHAVLGWGARWHIL